MLRIKCFFITILIIFSHSTIRADDLPLWMETSRVQPVFNSFYAVNRLPITSGKMYRGNENTDEVFSKAFMTLRSMGITAATELTKDNWRPPSWPSAVPSLNKKNPEIPNINASVLNNSADVVLSLSQNAQASGVRLGAYYWATGEGRPLGVDTRTPKSKYLYKTDSYQWSPPESWLCKNLDGSLAAVTLPNGTIRGYYFDFTSPQYRKFTLQRFRELSHRNVDNIFFDERHQPNHEDDGCFGGATEAAYVKRFGKAELPRKKNFNDRKYRQYITFQGQKLAESFRYWKTELEKEFGDDRPLFTINGLYLSGFTFPHMSFDMLEVADSVKVEFRNGVRDFISEGFKRPDIDPVFRPPVKIPRPPNDIRTAMALVIARDGANGRPFTSWAVEHDFDTKEKANVIHATVAAYGGIIAPNINFKNMSGVVLKQPTHKNFTNNLKDAVNLVKKMEPSLAFARPYKFAAIHISEAQRNTKLTAASIWRDIMWPVHSAFEFFVRKGLPASIITDKQISEGKLNDYNIVYLTWSNLEKTPIYLQSRIKEFKQRGGVIIWKDKNYKIGKTPRELNALSELIITNSKVRVEYGNGIPSNINPHAIFFSKNKGETDLVAVLNDFTHVLHRQAKSKNKNKPIRIRNAQLILDYKPFSITEVIRNKKLEAIKLESGKYQVNIPEFDTVTFLSIQKSNQNMQPLLDINPTFSNISNKVTAEVYLNESSCSENYNLDWGDGSSQKIKPQNNCPKTINFSHSYKNQGSYPVTLAYQQNSKVIKLQKRANIKNMKCSIKANSNIVKKGQSVTLSWKSEGADFAILSHGAGLVNPTGKFNMKAQVNSSRIEYKLTLYEKNMSHFSSCSAVVRYN